MKTFCIFISLIGINRFEPTATVRVHDIVVLIFLLIFSIILLLKYSVINVLFIIAK